MKPKKPNRDETLSTFAGSITRMMRVLRNGENQDWDKVLTTLDAVVNTSFQLLMPEEKEKDIFTQREVEAMLNVSKSTMEKYRREGWISYTQVGNQFWYTKKDLEDFLTRYHVPALESA